MTISVLNTFTFILEILLILFMIIGLKGSNKPWITWVRKSLVLLLFLCIIATWIWR